MHPCMKRTILNTNYLMTMLQRLQYLRHNLQGVQSLLARGFRALTDSSSCIANQNDANKPDIPSIEHQVYLHVSTHDEGRPES